MTWLRASDQLPDDRQVVLVVLSDYAHQRVQMSMFTRGDPSSEGLYYAADKWPWLSQAVKPTDYWMPLPELPVTP